MDADTPDDSQSAMNNFKSTMNGPRAEKEEDQTDLSSRAGIPSPKMDIDNLILSIKSDVMDTLDVKLKNIFHNVVWNFETERSDPSLLQKSTTDVTDSHSFHKSRKNVVKNGISTEKVFVPRRSVLTDLFEIPHIRTIYNVFVALMIVFSFNVMANDILDRGTIFFPVELVAMAFADFQTVLGIWANMIVFTIGMPYLGLRLWIRCRQRLQSHTMVVDTVGVVLYVSGMVGLLTLPVQAIIKSDLPGASAIIITCEQVRQFMKIHSFVRENIPKALERLKTHEGRNFEEVLPDFSKYLYFLFIPTLIYRDNYPRTKKIRWNFVFVNLFEVIGCIFYSAFIFCRFCVPIFQRFGTELITVESFVRSVFSCIMPGTLILVLSFYAILHAWMNAFAEIMTFADRMFYQDWWNQRSFSAYYRTWNVIVHDWLFAYIYRDIINIIGQSRKMIALLAVFLISALVHEFIICVSMRIFYPILFFMFGCFGVVFMFIRGKSEAANIMMWLGLMIGSGLLFCLYSQEWYASINCPVDENVYLDYIIPRSFACHHGTNHTEPISHLEL